MPDLDMEVEQGKDDALLEMKMQLIHGDPSKPVQRNYIVIDHVLYYITDPDNEPVLRLYIPEHLRERVVKQYHDH